MNRTAATATIFCILLLHDLIHQRSSRAPEQSSRLYNSPTDAARQPTLTRLGAASSTKDKEPIHAGFINAENLRQTGVIAACGSVCEPVAAACGRRRRECDDDNLRRQRPRNGR